ncbi:unnamed protein product, partial [Ectocarpus sp. 12 AP-2014]
APPRTGSGTYTTGCRGMRPLLRRARDSWALGGAGRWPRPAQGLVLRHNYHPPGYDSKGKQNPPEEGVTTASPLPTAKPPPPQPPGTSSSSLSSGADQSLEGGGEQSQGNDTLGGTAVSAVEEGEG